VLDQFAGEGRKAFVVPLGPTQIQHIVATLAQAAVRKPLFEAVHENAAGLRGTAAEQTDERRSHLRSSRERTR
jgi:hypothetical protein